VDKITRKELKTDHFALEVGHAVEVVSEHRKQFTLYGGVAIGVILVATAVYYYLGQQAAQRQAVLKEAIRIQDAVVTASGAPEGMVSFATAAEKDKAVRKAFGDLASKYPGKDEGVIARYYLGINAADAGQFAEAEKAFSEVANTSSPYAPLGRFALAQIYEITGKVADAEREYRALAAKPSMMVSEGQAKIALGKLLLRTKPEEGRKLLEPLRTAVGPVSRAAIDALSQPTKN
jgi:Flp pilus assembly protein TadD